jgi:predicted dienelactone hydrolase
MKTFILATALAVFSSLAYAEDMTGLTLMPVTATHHAKPIETAVWYPGSGGKSVSFGENPVFQGVAVQEGAEVTQGRYPIVLLSHGLGGNYRTLGWLGAGLAEHGAIVIAVNHPNSTTRDFDLKTGLDHRTRVQDLEAALANVSSNPAFADHIDPSRIYAAGFSYGGWTALSMGGLRGNLNAYATHCEGAGAASTHCNDINKGGVDLRTLDATRWNASYKDVRIRAVAAIDPALTWGLEKSETQDLVKDILLIGLGEGKDRLQATNFSASGSGFEQKIEGLKVKTIAPASHFSALLVCKPAGEAILAIEKDDPVCTDPKGTDRKSVHDTIIAEVAKHFGLD